MNIDSPNTQKVQQGEHTYTHTFLPFSRFTDVTRFGWGVGPECLHWWAEPAAVGPSCTCFFDPVTAVALGAESRFYGLPGVGSNHINLGAWFLRLNPFEPAKLAQHVQQHALCVRHHHVKEPGRARAVRS